MAGREREREWERKREREWEIWKGVLFIHYRELYHNYHIGKEEKDMFVVHCSGLLGKKKKGKQCNTRRVGGETARISRFRDAWWRPKAARERPSPSRPSSINRQHFDIARLLVYLSRSFLQNKENGFDKKNKQTRNDAFLRGDYFTKAHLFPWSAHSWDIKALILGFRII